MVTLHDSANFLPNNGCLFVLIIYIKRFGLPTETPWLGCWLALLAGVLLFLSTSICPFGHPLDTY